ncbi:MAG: uridine kinase [Acutalibacteraceae bacterium]
MPKIFLSQLEKELNSNPMQMISSAEKHYKSEIDELANAICSQSHLKVVLLAGPSGSGKTTSANMLCDKIKQLGHKCSVVSLDDFFKNTNEYPLNPDGTPDFESIYSLEIELIISTLLEIIEKGSAMLPTFDFENQRRLDNTKRLELGAGGILIIEGIHALNPIISDSLPQENICRVFVSVSTGIKNDAGREILSGIQIRMLRRTIRDSLYRGFDVANTLSVWQGVLDGEQKYLYPYKPLADYKINTFHSYEPFIYGQYLRDYMDDELSAVSGSKFYGGFETAMSFAPIDLSLVPETSLIKEFIPGGVYEDLY